MIYVLLLAFLAALNVADWWTTRRILGLGGVEKNPAMDWVLRRFGFIGLAVVKTVTTGFAVVAGLVWPALWPMLALLCAVHCWVIVNNVRVMRRLEQRGG